MKYTIRKQKAYFTGYGSTMQFSGMVTPFVFAMYGGAIGFFVGLIIGGCFLFIGSKQAIYYVCSGCGNEIDKKQDYCPHCQSHIITWLQQFKHLLVLLSQQSRKLLNHHG